MVEKKSNKKSKTKKFRLTSKIIIGTFGTDYLNQINCDKIFNYYTNKKTKDGKECWEVLVVKAHGDEEIQHDHFHFITFWIGKDKKGDIQNDKYFDIPIEQNIYSFENENGDKIYNFQKDISDFALGNLLNLYKKWTLLTVAHPNFKGKDNKKFGSEYDMLKYVWDQKIEYKCNFNVEAKLEELKCEKLLNKKNLTKTKQIKEELAEYVRSQWLAGAPLEEVKQQILKNKEYANIYIYNTSIQNFVEKQFKQIKPIQPTPIFGKYYVPNELAEFLEYLNEWGEKYYNEVIIPCKENKFDNYEEAMKSFYQKYLQRGKAIIFYGKGGIGKTCLFSCYGPCSYWKDRFNYDQWNNWGFFNWFDDVDIFTKKYNNETHEITAADWEYLKTWIGGQQQSTINGKYRTTKTIFNLKPCVFITNIPINERFSENAIQYMKDLNTVIFVNCYESLFTKKDTKTIGGFTKWREIDTTKTFYYKLLKNKKKEEKNKRKQETEEEDCINDYNKKQKTVLEYEEEEPILLDNGKTDLTIPNINNNFDYEPPRANSNISIKNFTPSTSINPYNDNISNLDGTTHCIARKNYIIRCLNNIKDRINYFNSKIEILQKKYNKLHTKRKRLNNEYNNSYTNYYLKNKYYYMGIKEIEEMRFTKLSKLKEINNTILDIKNEIKEYHQYINNLIIEYNKICNIINNKKY